MFRCKWGGPRGGRQKKKKKYVFAALQRRDRNDNRGKTEKRGEEIHCEGRKSLSSSGLKIKKGRMYKGKKPGKRKRS